MRITVPLLLLAGVLGSPPAGLVAQDTRTYTRADTLRGSFATPGRAWWDVTFYDLNVSIQPADSAIRGHNAITYRVLTPAREMQIDLMTPLVVDSMVQDGRAVPFRRDGHAIFVSLAAEQPQGKLTSISGR